VLTTGLRALRPGGRQAALDAERCPQR
jgi:hypothetical protein